MGTARHEVALAALPPKRANAMRARIARHKVLLARLDGIQRALCVADTYVLTVPARRDAYVMAYDRLWVARERLYEDIAALFRECPELTTAEWWAQWRALESTP